MPIRRPAEARPAPTGFFVPCLALLFRLTSRHTVERSRPSSAAIAGIVNPARHHAPSWIRSSFVNRRPGMIELFQSLSP